MNKEQYMGELKSKLAGFDEELVNEIISDYEEHFSLGYAQGKSDEEIIEKLGDINDLVKEISESYERVNSGERKNNFEYKANIDFDLSSLNKLGEQINKATANITKQVSDMVNNELNKAFGPAEDDGTTWDERLSSKVSDFFTDLYNQATKEPDVDFHSFDKDDAEEEQSGFEQEQEFEEDHIKHVIVRNFCGEVKVNKGDRRFHANYSCEGSLKQELGYHMDFNFNGDTAILTLKQSDFMRHSSFHSNPNLYLDIELNGVDSLAFENCISSDIEINEVELKKLSCELTSGELALTDVNSDELIFFSNSGNLLVNNYEGNAVDVKSTSGDIQFSEANIHAMRVASVSGDITVDDGSIERLGAVSTSGDISVNGNNLIQFAAETVSGDVDATLARNGEGRVKTTSGDIHLALDNQSEGFKVKLKTLSGDVDINYGDQDLSGLKNGEYTFGSDNIKLVLATLSGDIEITE